MTTHTEGETPRRTVRVPDRRWDRFGELAAARGSDRATELNAHMQSEIDKAERKAKTK